VRGADGSWTPRATPLSSADFHDRRLSGKIREPTLIGDRKMPDETQQVGVEQLRILADVEKTKSRNGFLKILWGTAVVGVAAAFFPFAQQFAVSLFSERIERIQRESEIELLEEKNRLEEELSKIKLELEQKTVEFEQSQSKVTDSRTFLESVAKEGRSSQIDSRIILAEYFSFLAETEDERERWRSFREHLYRIRQEQNSAITAQERIANDPNADPLDRSEAVSRLRQIEQYLNPQLNQTWSEQLSFSDLGIERNAVNGSLQPASRELLSSILGEPRESYSETCEPVTNERLSSLLATFDVGSFRVTLIRPAGESLQRIFQRLREESPDLYSSVGTAGGLCVRLLRGSRSTISNHSWGTSIDITIDGKLDSIGQDTVSRGTAALARYFIDEGWYWGAGYGRMDAMSFEVSAQLLQKWSAEGLLTPAPSVASE
jgi:Skp family chaperone for outer membrane proteins